MKYFSEMTKKVYDSVEELEAAEKKAQEAKDERKVASEKVEAAYHVMKEAKQTYEKTVEAYNDELAKFCNKYGSYKTTLRPGELFNLDPFWKFFNF